MNTISLRDIWVMASGILATYGEAAVDAAARQSEAFLTSGDEKAAAVWVLVAEATRQLARMAPEEGELLH